LQMDLRYLAHDDLCSQVFAAFFSIFFVWLPLFRTVAATPAVSNMPAEAMSRYFFMQVILYP
jgi:hypothetical protein